MSQIIHNMEMNIMLTVLTTQKSLYSKSQVACKSMCQQLFISHNSEILCDV